MHSFNNRFAEKKCKTLLCRVYLKAIFRNNLNTKTFTRVKQFL